MGDMITLVLIVCFVAIIAFFAQEFNRIFKKIFAIKGMKLILPLALGSWCVYSFDFLVLEVLNKIRDKLKLMNEFLISVLPHNQFLVSVVLIFFLTAVSVVPVLALHFFSYRKANKPYSHPYLLSTLIWIIAAILLVSLPVLFHR